MFMPTWGFSAKNHEKEPHFQQTSQSGKPRERNIAERSRRAVGEEGEAAGVGGDVDLGDRLAVEPEGEAVLPLLQPQVVLDGGIKGRGQRLDGIAQAAEPWLVRVTSDG